MQILSLVDDYKPRGQTATSDIRLFKNRESAFADACESYICEFQGDDRAAEQESETSDDNEEPEFYYSTETTEKNFYNLRSTYNQYNPGNYIPAPDFQIFVYQKEII